MYESDITRFIRELLEKNPALYALQQNNRATWWDKTLDAELQRQFDEAKAPGRGYAYFPLPSD